MYCPCCGTHIVVRLCASCFSAVSLDWKHCASCGTAQPSHPSDAEKVAVSEPTSSTPRTPSTSSVASVASVASEPLGAVEVQKKKDTSTPKPKAPKGKETSEASEASEDTKPKRLFKVRMRRDGLGVRQMPIPQAYWDACAKLSPNDLHQALREVVQREQILLLQDLPKDAATVKPQVALPVEAWELAEEAAQRLVDCGDPLHLPTQTPFRKKILALGFVRAAIYCAATKGAEQPSRLRSLRDHGSD